ncbi:MAG: polysaccharide deacetylase family protein [Candidatus Omnitrophica bacterium]|nr:polysaccharide deacetylase family protein [Candidatus Omnitrophota bacterium]
MKAVIQVDLDSLWTYRRYRNLDPPAPGAIDPVYSVGVKRFLDMFRKNSIKATFFVIGSDALIPEHARIIKEIVEEGHEIANHTMSHPLNFSSLAEEIIIEEIKKSHEILERLSGKKVRGFRAPMFSIDERVLKILKGLAYVYDSSVLPSFIAPLALNCAHSILGGGLRNISGSNIRFANTPLCLYRPDMENMAKRGQGKLYELPISVMPGLRLPMHSTYVFICGRWLFDWGLREMRKKQIHLNYLFHGIDLLDIIKYDLKLPLFGGLEKRKNICEYIIERLKSECEVMSTLDLIGKNGWCA